MSELDPKYLEQYPLDHVDLVEDEVVLGLRDGTALVYSCKQILALNPLRVVHPEDS